MSPQLCLKALCQEAGVPYQTFTNRSDILGGSTLGNISNTKVALNTVDIGLPQLAMHSPYETAGVEKTLGIWFKPRKSSTVKESFCTSNI